MRSQQFRQELVGKVVTATERDAEGIGLTLGGEWSLSIWCGVTLIRAEKAVDLASLHDVEGQTLVSFVAEADTEQLSFSDGTALVIRPSARSTAEAMMLRGPGSQIVVWNE